MVGSERGRFDGECVEVVETSHSMGKNCCEVLDSPEGYLNHGQGQSAKKLAHKKKQTTSSHTRLVYINTS